MNNIWFDEQWLSCVNLYPNLLNLDDFSLISVCKNVVDNNVGYISVPENYLEKTWNWMELSNVKINSILNNFAGNLNTEALFLKIKNSFNHGADCVEIVLPSMFFDIDVDNIPEYVDDVLSAIAETKSNKNKEVKVVIESAFINDVMKLKGIVYLLSKYKIDWIKTSSGLYSKSSNLDHLNSILEESVNSNIKVDFLFDRSLLKDLVIPDAFKLFKYFYKDNISKYCTSILNNDFSAIIEKLLHIST